MPLRSRKHRAFVFIDAVLALAIIGLLSLTLSVGIASERKGLRGLDDSRQAVRTAEGQLITSQNLRPLANCDEDASMQWVTTHAQVNGRGADLVGLAPRGGQ